MGGPDATAFTAPITGPGGEFLGVETEEQTVLLSKQKCYRAQGFAFCKPVPAEELTARLDTWPGMELHTSSHGAAA
jgi:predicted signal transduction protein with EAL and GGDEF domain